jgi:hypothetical protein
MDLEELSKSQLLMLMILVNFIVSIATGVLTVSLLQQAPQTVTQTVNQIVDHTIETVATGTPLATVVSAPTPSQPVTKTVVESLDTQLTSAITDMSERTVEIYGSGGTTTPLAALGTYLPEADAVVTATQDGLPMNGTIEFPDGTVLNASVSHTGATITIYGFSNGAILPHAASPTIVPHTSLKVGQTIVSYTADGSAVTGIISKIDDSLIYTNLPVTPAGNALVDLNGNIVGISNGVAGQYFFAEKINTLLTSPTASAATSSPPSS